MGMHLRMAEFNIPAGLVIFMDARLASFEARRGDLQDEYQGILDQADAEDRDLNAEEIKATETLRAQIANIDVQIIARKGAAPAPSAGRRTAADPDDRPTNRTIPGLPSGGGRRVDPQVKNEKDKGTFGFDSFGAFAQAVTYAVAGDKNGEKHEHMQRIVNATTTYGNEGTGGDGGFLVPPDFRSSIWQKVLGEDSLFSRVQQFVTSGNGITFPKDETAPWDTTNGVQAYWGGEGDVKTPSKPVFSMTNLRLNKLFSLVPVSDELLEDAPGLESWLRVKAPQKMQARLNTALVRGNGVGKPLGFLNAASLITVSKEVSQDADTIVYANIVKMWARMYAPLRRNAVWLINQDVEPQLLNLAFREDASSPVPAYMPAGGLSSSPFATLMGRPVVPVEAASTIGDKGDIALVDWSQYMGLTKGRDIQTDVSMHIYFDQDLTAFRFVLRVAGQPLWGSTITPENGSLTRSWAVVLEDRA